MVFYAFKLLYKKNKGFTKSVRMAVLMKVQKKSNIVEALISLVIV